MLDDYIDNLKNDIIKHTCNLINIPSVSVETNDLDIPFGKDAKDALDYILKLGKDLGFRTKNIDNYCGYIEFGDGPKLVGIVGHLDVVPSGDGWETPPFNATISNGKIFGRGAIDDKGPVVASLYAMKAIMDNSKVDSRIRLILGVNEEKSWKCIRHYKEVEEHPDIGFSPDADFPCIYAEKGIATFYLKDNYTQYNNLPIKITSIDCNKNAINVVPKFCSTTLNIDTLKININDIKKFIDEQLINSNFDISYSIQDNTITLTSLGIQAHSAHPDLGKNAISPLIVLLNRLFKHFGFTINLFEFFEKTINTEYDGKSLGINVNDESGALTLNVGNFGFYEENLQIGLNLRIPVNTPINTISDLIHSKCSQYNSIETLLYSSQAPLYVSKDNYLVKTLCNIFNKKTNSNFEPISIGGGTYARAFNNCISFGANFPGDTDMCHQANEFIDIEKLILTCKIYADAIYELSKNDKAKAII